MPTTLDSGDGTNFYTRSTQQTRLVPRLSSVCGVILARMDSRRFPGKALAPWLGVPLVQYVIRRARLITGMDAVCLATTDRPVDDPLVAIAQDEGIPVFRGHPSDVTKRVIDCAKTLCADWVVRLNGDSPFLDPSLISYGISLIDSNVEFITNIPERTFPYGVSVEIISVPRLMASHPAMTLAQREHVTLYFYQTDERIPTVQLRLVPPVSQDVRLTIDTPEDLQRLEEMVTTCGSCDWRTLVDGERTVQIRRLHVA